MCYKSVYARVIPCKVNRCVAFNPLKKKQNTNEKIEFNLPKMPFTKSILFVTIPSSSWEPAAGPSVTKD